jgi:hypothetical protein
MCHPLIQRRTKESASRPVVILVIAASLIACGNTAFAQDSTAGAISDIGGIVAPTADEGPLHAAIRRAGAQLAQSPALTPQAQPNWVVRHPVITGTMIGAGAGAVLSRTQAVGGYNHDPRVMLVGAGAGAWGGLVAGAIHKARAKEKVGVGTKIGIAVGAVGMIVLPWLACYGAGGCGGVS